MAQIMNHREIEYYTKKYWQEKKITDQKIVTMFADTPVQKIEKQTPQELVTWLEETYQNVCQKDLEMDYGMDCIRCYLLFEKTPKKQDPYFDTWDEGGLEGVYKFVSKYRRMILTALEANRQGKYADTDVSSLLAKVEQMKQESMMYMQKENTMPNRHNVISVFMEGFKQVQKELRISELTMQEHTHEIETAMPHAQQQQVPEQEIDQMMQGKQNREMITLCKHMVVMMAPWIPYISEELWQAIWLYEKAQQKEQVSLTGWYRHANESTSVLEQRWTVNLARTEKKLLSIPVQINARTKRILQINDEVTEEQVEELAKNEIQKFLKSGANYRTIYVKHKLINFVEI